MLVLQNLAFFKNNNILNIICNILTAYSTNGSPLRLTIWSSNVHSAVSKGLF
jgi:hypothetical protein